MLEHLRHIRSRVDGLADDMRHVIFRPGSLERHVAGLHISERRLELNDG